MLFLHLDRGRSQALGRGAGERVERPPHEHRAAKVQFSGELEHDHVVAGGAARGSAVAGVWDNTAMVRRRARVVIATLGNCIRRAPTRPRCPAAGAACFAGRRPGIRMAPRSARTAWPRTRSTWRTATAAAAAPGSPPDLRRAPGARTESTPGIPPTCRRTTSGRYCEETSRFIRWSVVDHRHARDLIYGTVRWTGPRSALDGEKRWEDARRLLADGTVPTPDRVAGLLLLLYAHRRSVIGTLTPERVLTDDAGNVKLQMGSSPTALPELLARLVLDLVAIRRPVQRGRRSGHQSMAVPGTTSRPAHQRDTVRRPARSARDQARAVAIDGTVHPRDRTTRRDPRPDARHPRQGRRPVAKGLGRRLVRLRRRHQQPLGQPEVVIVTTPTPLFGAVLCRHRRRRTVDRLWTEVSPGAVVMPCLSDQLK